MTLNQTFTIGNSVSIIVSLQFSQNLSCKSSHTIFRCLWNPWNYACKEQLKLDDFKWGKIFRLVSVLVWEAVASYICVYITNDWKNVYCDCSIDHRWYDDNVCAWYAEPMLTIGSSTPVMWDDNWTVVTEDGSLSAQFEHTILITQDGAEILTKC